jgi:phospholipid-binding lipoprotein MlaA
MKRTFRNLLLALLLTGAAGCATTGGDSRDPLEGYNRAVYSFNDTFDHVLAKPVAIVYHDVLPSVIRTGVRNFFANIADLWIGANNLMQGKPADAITDWARFAFNSSFGILGLIDIASDIGIEKHDEDFGQTLGRWGLSDGAYIVWPVIGSSTLRDSVGLIPDYAVDPVWNIDPHGARYWTATIRFVGRRADLLDASRILEEAALDKYVFQRDAHLQRRRNLVYDGNPPRAAREQPRADSSDPVSADQPVSGPQGSPLPVSETPVVGPGAAAMEAAVRLLELPASPAASTGG